MDADEFEVKRQYPLIWQSYNPSVNETAANDLTTSCRNSVQGKVLLVDDRGFVCNRPDLLFTGCCDVETNSAKLYSCDTCNDHGCCTIYEHCISCCLNPDKVTIIACKENHH